MLLMKYLGYMFHQKVVKAVIVDFNMSLDNSEVFHETFYIITLADISHYGDTLTIK